MMMSRHPQALAPAPALTLRPRKVLNHEPLTLYHLRYVEWHVQSPLPMINVTRTLALLPLVYHQSHIFPVYHLLRNI